MMMNFRWLCLIITLLLLASCGPEESKLEIPEAPDMSEVLAAYDSPSAELTQDTIQTIVESFQRWQEYRNLVCGTDTCDSGLFCAICPGMASLDGLLASAMTQEAQSEQDDTTVEEFGSREGALAALDEATGTQFEGAGYIRATRPCLGDPNASMNLTLTVSDSGLNPVVWGSIDGCDIAFSGSTTRVYLNFQLNLGASTEPITFSDNGLENLRAIVLRLNGKLVRDEDTYDLEVDLKSLMDRAEVQLRIPVGTQHVLFYLSYLDDAVDYGFEAINGRWACDFPLDPATLLESGNTIECTQSGTDITLSFSF